MTNHLSPPAPSNREVHEYVVGLHAHTTFSDGSGSIDEVIEAGRKAGLDVLMITDHESLAAREEGYEGWHDGLLVLAGFEASGPHNHILVFGLDRVPDHEWSRPQPLLDTIRSHGGLSFLAHPHEVASPLAEGGRAYTWQDWSVHGFTGLEIWNHSSSWKKPVQNYAAGLFRYFACRWTLSGPENATLAKWDEIGQHRTVAGVAGPDAHAVKRKLGPFVFWIFPYDYHFRAVTTHVMLPAPLSGNLDADRRAVFKALAGGHAFISHDRLHSARGFDFRLEKEGRRLVGMGDEWEFEDGLILRWDIPGKAHTVLMRDSRPCRSEKETVGAYELTEKGVYRLEVHYPTLIGRRPWMYSNPVYVR